MPITPQIEKDLNSYFPEERPRGHAFLSVHDERSLCKKKKKTNVVWEVHLSALEKNYTYMSLRVGRVTTELKRSRKNSIVDGTR